jgi:hypothetical protein
MHIYFSRGESDQLLAKAVKCRLLAQAAPADQTARFLTALADEFEMEAHQVEGGCPE